MGIVYILQDDNGRYYVGSTSDLSRRLNQREQKHTWTTQRFKNPKLVLSQSYPSLQEARKIELKIKKMKRKDYIDKMVLDGYIKVRI